MSVDPSTEVDAEAGVDTDIETSGDTNISTANTTANAARSPVSSFSDSTLFSSALMSSYERSEIPSRTPPLSISS